MGNKCPKRYIIQCKYSKSLLYCIIIKSLCLVGLLIITMSLKQTKKLDKTELTLITNHYTLSTVSSFDYVLL